MDDGAPEIVLHQVRAITIAFSQWGDSQKMESHRRATAPGPGATPYYAGVASSVFQVM